MRDDLERVLIPADRIAARLDELGAQLNAEWADDEMTLVPVMTGSFIFAADIVRLLPRRMQLHLISVTSYPGTATSSQGASLEPTLTKLPDDLAGRHVLVVDDILDSGRTLRLVVEALRQRGPACVKTCVLLRKQRPEAMDFPVDYVAFDIPDEFVVGYGLDYDGYYRNLPEIGVLSPRVIAAYTPSNGADRA
jgi:hypoxanthine phosphoribosyltransferase